MGTKVRYEDDFLLWTQSQAAAMRTNLPIDFEHVAEEIEDLGRSTRHAVRSYCAQIIAHLLKPAHSPAPFPRRGWEEEIERFRIEICLLLDESPSLRGQLDDLVRGAWKLGRQMALADLARDGLDGSDLPAVCPYSATDVLGG